MKLSVYRIASNQLRTTRIKDVETESPTVKTFTFKDRLCAKAKPGQFVMLWIPGLDEIPLSVLDAGIGGLVSVAVKRVGEATSVLHGIAAGDVLSVRGPFGNSFSLGKGKALMVAGGTGTAPLLFLARKLVSGKGEPAFLVGAKTKEELLFLDELERLCGKENVVATTEDGSCGVRGLCTAPFEELLAKMKPNMVYACGPERMILKAFELAEARSVGFEASLERLMRCAIGLCGSCVVGRYRVCRDGPVFTGEQLREVRDEFGKSKLDFDGRRIPI